MPPKKGKKVSKKGEAKRQNKVIEDKTFGLKNKNKSKKVQQYVNQVTKQVRHGARQRGEKTPEERAAEKKAKKAMEAQQEKELRMLFNEALGGGFVGAPKVGRRKKGAKERAEMKKRAEEAKKREEEAAKAVDPYAGLDPLERIEAMRNDLHVEGFVGTEVNAESLNAWVAEMQAQAKEVAEKKVQEAKRTKGGKGLAVLTGKELFQYNSDLFQDDEAATGAEEMVAPVDAPPSDDEEEEGGDEGEGAAGGAGEHAVGEEGEPAQEAPAAGGDTAAVDETLFGGDDDDLDDLDDLDDEDDE